MLFCDEFVHVRVLSLKAANASIYDGRYKLNFVSYACGSVLKVSCSFKMPLNRKVRCLCASKIYCCKQSWFEKILVKVDLASSIFSMFSATEKKSDVERPCMLLMPYSVWSSSCAFDLTLILYKTARFRTLYLSVGGSQNSKTVHYNCASSKFHKSSERAQPSIFHTS